MVPLAALSRGKQMLRDFLDHLWCYKENLDDVETAFLFRIMYGLWYKWKGASVISISAVTKFECFERAAWEGKGRVGSMPSALSASFSDCLVFHLSGYMTVPVSQSPFLRHFKDAPPSRVPIPPFVY